MLPEWPEVNEHSYLNQITPTDLDALLAEGWRHFGRLFFRYSITEFEGEQCHVMPLRLSLVDWHVSKSERRTLRKNTDLKVEWGAAQYTGEVVTLFEKHKERFTENIPESLSSFLGEDLDEYPCELRQLNVYDGGRLVAVSYLDIGAHSVSSVYAIFDPEYSRRRLGIYTMLLEMEYAKGLGMLYYYSGYSTIESSAYDYKKQLKPQLYYHWRHPWIPL